MNIIRGAIFDLLCNAFLQIGFFSLMAAAFSRPIARAKPKHQWLVYLTVFAMALVVPVVNTFWPPHRHGLARVVPHQAQPIAAWARPLSWPWPNASSSHGHFGVQALAQDWIVLLWGMLALYRFVQFGREVCLVHRLRRGASALSLPLGSSVRAMVEARPGITLLQSALIDDPVTIGVFRPAIVMPSKVLPYLLEQDLVVALAHEYAHIRRKDVLTHILCELASVPVAWHPGVRYLLSKVSRTRELACDEYAADCLGKRRAYARTLLRLASLCLRTPRLNTAALGLFDADNLEVRIMMLTEKKRSLSHARVAGLALAMSTALGMGAVLAHATSLQANSPSSDSERAFAGTWHWMFDGRSFATMVLVPSGSGLTGTVTESWVKLKDDGTLARADAAENATPVPIVKAEMDGTALRVTAKDGFAFTVTLRDQANADIHPVGAPADMKPIPAEKVQ